MKRVQEKQWWTALPFLTMGIATAWILAALLVQLGYSARLGEINSSYYSATSLAIREPIVEVKAQHLAVVRAVEPNFENDPVLAFMRNKSASPDEHNPQSTFDALAERGIQSLAGHPFRTMAFVPSQTPTTQFLTHAWIHSGFMHLFSTLMLLLLAGPILEATWGRLLYGLCIAAVPPITAAAFYLVGSDGEHALVGGSALIAALVAAVIVRQRDEQLDFLGWLPPQLNAELIAPAWTLGILWVFYEAFLWIAIPGSLPSGIDNAVGSSAHLAGALVGGIAALAAQKLNLEPEAQKGGVSITRRSTVRFDLDRVLALRAEGEEDAALLMLQAEVLNSARNRDAVKLYWDMSVEREQAEQAAPILHQLLKEELRRGASREAAGVWRIFTDQLPEHSIDVPTLLQLAPAVAQLEGSKGALELMKQCIAKDSEGLTGAMAHKVAKWSIELDPKLAQVAATRALGDSDLDPRARDELTMLLAAMAPEEPNKKKSETPAPAPNAFFEESDRSAFGESEDLSAMMNDCFPDGVVMEATPMAFGEASISVRDKGKDTDREVEYTRIRGIAAVGVRGLSPKPVVIIDLLIDGGGENRPLSVIRFRADQFDPRRLVPNTTSIRRALHAFIETMESHTGAKSFADITSSPPRPKIIFDDLDVYHDKILRPAAEHLN